jgi:two-component system, cell cycle sensor histidine kinase and response regulator CckA
MDLASLTSNLDYVLFTALVVVAFAYKSRRIQQTDEARRLAMAERLLILLILVGGWFLVDAVGHHETRRIRQMVEGLAPTYAAELERMGHGKITLETPPDDPTYLQLTEAEIRWQKLNPVVHDIYTLRKRPDGKNVFIVGSETDYDRNGKYEGEREQRTKIGEIYPETDDGLERAFLGDANFYDKPVTDRRGTWISAFEPMRDSNGRVEAVLGVDYDARAWARSVMLSRFVVICFLAAIFATIGTFATIIALMRKQLAERKRTEESLRNSDQKLSLHLRQTPLAVIEFDREFHIKEWNPAAERIFGYSEAEIKGRDGIDVLVAPSARSQVDKIKGELLSNTGGTRSTNENTTKDGRIILCEWFNTSLKNSAGEVIGVASLCQDVTERKKAAAEIENLAAFPRFNPDAVIQFSSDGTLIYSNDAAQQMAHSIGKLEIADILPPETAVIVQQCLANGSEKIKRETAFGKRTISWSFFSIPSLQCVHCYAFEVTDLLNLEAQLRQSQKMQSVGQLAAGIAHDFNNILTIIQGHTELVTCEENLPDTARESLDQISMAAQRAANLTRQLLTFGRKQFMQVELLDLNEVIKSVTQMLRRALGENITLRSNLSAVLPSIEADSTMMEQVVMNLSLNARDAMSNGGSLIITTNPVKVGREHVLQNPEAREGVFICLTVSDNGCGMDRVKLGKIFEPFFTTKEVGKGTGLGLATVYGIVKQHNGWIEVESEPGKGTAFKIFFPASTKRAVVQAAKEPGVQVKGGKETILLVEDEPGVLTLARSVLKTYGYQVIEAKSGVDALRVWEQYDTRINLLLTDMVMPGGMSGHDLAKKLRTEKHDLRVIYTSGYSMEALGQDFSLGKGMLFLKKPYNPQTLAQMVRDCLDSRT